MLLALALKPRVLLLDEPAAGLSPAERVDIQALLTVPAAELTLVMIEHDIDCSCTAWWTPRPCCTWARW